MHACVTLTEREKRASLYRIEFWKTKSENLDGAWVNPSIMARAVGLGYR